MNPIMNQNIYYLSCHFLNFSKCEKVIGKSNNLTDVQLGKVCPRCTCSFEVRNTTTMKVKRIFVSFIPKNNNSFLHSEFIQ